ncbi:MAG: hypothetical protein M1426_05750 [Patescibacteria group bacterium]|nr:hypothetical protein [Patescibacteria group bacterium]
MLSRERWFSRFIPDRFKRELAERTVLPTEYKPENIDPQRISDFLGNWRYWWDSNGCWIFAFPEDPRETGVFMEISPSQKFVRISTGDPIRMSIAMPDVESVRILAEGQEYRPGKADNPRLGIFTPTGFMLLYSQNLDVTRIEYSRRKPHFAESHIPFGDIAAYNKLISGIS